MLPFADILRRAIRGQEAMALHQDVGCASDATGEIVKQVLGALCGDFTFGVSLGDSVVIGDRRQNGVFGFCVGKSQKCLIDFVVFHGGRR